MQERSAGLPAAGRSAVFGFGRDRIAFAAELPRKLRDVGRPDFAAAAEDRGSRRRPAERVFGVGRRVEIGARVQHVDRPARPQRLHRHEPVGIGAERRADSDDFLIFVAGGYDDAAAEKQALADWLRGEMGLTLSEEKTRITRLTEGFRFLGCRVRLKWDDCYGNGCRIEIPKEVVYDLRWRIKRMLTQRTHLRSLESMLREINPILRGWGHYYRYYHYCIGAKRILYLLDWYVWRRLWLWMRGKHDGASRRRLYATWCRPSRAYPGARVWTEGGIEQYQMRQISVMRFALNWMRSPDFAKAFGEPDA